MFIGNGDVEGSGAEILHIAMQNANHFVPLYGPLIWKTPSWNPLAAAQCAKKCSLSMVALLMNQMR